MYPGGAGAAPDTSVAELARARNRFADRLADVTGAGAAVVQYLRRASYQGGADAASFQMGRDPDASDGGGCRSEHRPEDGVCAGAVEQQGCDDRSRAVPGEQDVPVADPEPAGPARERGGLEGQDSREVGGRRRRDGDSSTGGALGGGRWRAVIRKSATKSTVS